jgi:hypothetical protein
MKDSSSRDGRGRDLRKKRATRVDLLRKWPPFMCRCTFCEESYGQRLP